VNTEITDTDEFRGWVLYDAECRLCTGMVGRLRGLLAARHLAVLPLQTPWVRERLALPEPELLAEMRLLKPDGTVFGGADAFLEVCRYYRAAWPLYQLGRIPVVAKLLHAGYRWVARNRYCISGACGVTRPATDARKQHGKTLALFRRLTLRSATGFSQREKHHQTQRSVLTYPDFLPLVVLPVVALYFRAQLAPWVFMWAMAVALYAGCKWLTYRVAVNRGIAPAPLRVLGYLLAWPGMDAAEFLEAKNVPARPRAMEWALAMLKIALGLALLGSITRWAYQTYPLLAGWVGMTGIICVLHFGTFHLASIFWRRAGVAAAPMMRNPLVAKSVTEFWGARWNTAFNRIAFDFAYRPLRRLGTPFTATLLVFGLSGIIHELVISLPAQAGYGLPTAYFLIQGLGVAFERTTLGRKLGLGRGVRGWLFAVLVTAGPAFWLFHPPFIHHVILPMLTAIGAT
jgi:predicted DCC family thiol-disulfide oxidoreductase YuxK